MARPRKGAPQKTKVFFLTHGTPNSQSEPKGYVLESDLRTGMVNILEGFLPHARRFDREGEDRIHEAISEIRMMSVVTQHRFIDCLVDEHTNTICRLVYWRT